MNNPRLVHFFSLRFKGKEIADQVRDEGLKWKVINEDKLGGILLPFF